MSFKGRGWTAYFQEWLKGLSPFSSWLSPSLLYLGGQEIMPWETNGAPCLPLWGTVMWNSGSPSWLHIGITWEFFKIPLPRPHPRPISIRSWRWDPGISIFENDPGDSYTAKFENKSFRTKSPCLGMTRLRSSIIQLTFPEFPGRATGWGTEGSEMSGTETLLLWVLGLVWSPGVPIMKWGCWTREHLHPSMSFNRITQEDHLPSPCARGW